MRDDIPSLSAWIKKSRSEERDFLVGAGGFERLCLSISLRETSDCVRLRRVWFESTFTLSKQNKKDTRKDIFFLGGSGWIRTTEVVDNRFTVCPLWPLGNTPTYTYLIVKKWSWWTDSNPRPADYKSAALPTELHQHLNAQILYHKR